MKQESLYLDTSVISIHFDPRDPFLQRQTRKFWATLERYRVHISELVESEIQAARSPGLRHQMLELTVGMHSLDLTPESEELAEQYVQQGVFTARHFNDSLHAAIAAVAGLDYLVSWNFRHMVRPTHGQPREPPTGLQTP